MNSLEKLIAYCEQQEFKGWDPFDGLNSPIINKTILGKSRIFRLAWIQLFKRNPINLRPFVGIKKGYNTKGLALFLIGYCNLFEKKRNPQYLKTIFFLSDKLLELKTQGYSGDCWGYNFDWQARAFFQPKGTPTIVATSYAVEALIRAYNVTGKSNYLNAAISATAFVLKDLNRTYDQDKNYTISYSPSDKTSVYNAGLLGVKLLAIIYKITRENTLFENAKKIIGFVVDKQNLDGSWYYSPLAHHKWIDSFHTGFILECIYIYMHAFNDFSYQQNFDKGTKYYLDNFFTENGQSKYYNDKKHPIDIHSPAQLLVFLSKTGLIKKHKTLALSVYSWTQSKMQSTKGYFFYQKRKYFTNKISYIRWSQAWAFYALTYAQSFLYEENQN